jgi:hypothetical protein
VNLLQIIVLVYGAFYVLLEHRQRLAHSIACQVVVLDLTPRQQFVLHSLNTFLLYKHVLFKEALALRPYLRILRYLLLEATIVPIHLCNSLLLEIVPLGDLPPKLVTFSEKIGYLILEQLLVQWGILLCET